MVSNQKWTAVGYESWRRDAHFKGFDLGDGQPALLDLRCGDDILLFAHMLKLFLKLFCSYLIWSLYCRRLA